MSEYTLYSDGGARGNPGPAACAFVVYKNGQEIKAYASCLGSGTNNLAEYQGIKQGLQWLLLSSETPGNLSCYLDSQLVVNQLLGVYKIKHPVLQTEHFQVQQLIKQLAKKGWRVMFTHIPRAQNKRADKLLNEALDHLA